MIRIVLVDDHTIVRQGLRALLEQQSDLRVVGETGDGVEAVLLVERLLPDVMIVDMMMPSLTGTEVTRQVRQRSPRTQVVLLSMHASEGYVLEALRAGALAYVLKEGTAEELVRAVRQVAAGHRYLSEPLSDRAIAAYAKRAANAEPDPLESLTPRERAVLHLVAQGLTSRQIAERLVVSRRTVESHRANLKRKLDLKNTVDLVRFAVRQGLIVEQGI
jgi:DNA-binding NarL/FixJ family response regulator